MQTRGEPHFTLWCTEFCSLRNNVSTQRTEKQEARCNSWHRGPRRRERGTHLPARRALRMWLRIRLAVARSVPNFLPCEQGGDGQCAACLVSSYPAHLDPISQKCPCNILQLFASYYPIYVYIHVYEKQGVNVYTHTHTVPHIFACFCILMC